MRYKINFDNFQFSYVTTQTSPIIIYRKQKLSEKTEESMTKKEKELWQRWQRFQQAKVIKIFEDGGKLVKF